MKVNNKKSRRAYYQGIINELIKQNGKDNFTFRLMGERLNVSKQRAKQIVQYHHLDIPTKDYFATKEYADLKQLIESDMVSQYTFQELHEDRYKKFLPKSFIRDIVVTSGKSFLRLTNKVLYNRYFNQTKTEEKSKREMFAEVVAMFPDSKLNYSSFCSHIDDCKIPFKRMRKDFVNRKHLASKLRHEAWTVLVDCFLAETAINTNLYAMNQLHALYEDYAKGKGKPSIQYDGFRETIIMNKVPFAHTMPLALLNRLLTLEIDFKGLTNRELAEIHNAKFPHASIIPRMLNDYGLQKAIGRV